MIKYTITNQDRDMIFSTTDPETVKIKPHCHNGYIAAVNVYFSNILVGSFDTFTEAAEWLDENMTSSDE